MEDMPIKEMLPELNGIQLSKLQDRLLGFVEEAKEKELPLAHVEKRIKELFDEKTQEAGRQIP